MSIKATDKWTIVIKLATPSLNSTRFFFIEGHDLHIYPREAIEKWGDLNRWDRNIGTGPFIIKDYVPDSAITAVRNPDYWKRDVNYPQNQLPYVDKVQVLIIPDVSTRLAALRAGKLDTLENLTWDDLRTLQKTNPEIITYKRRMGTIPSVAMLLDRPPFNDIRVRTAMQMALDLKTLAINYYGGIPNGLPVSQGRTAGYFTPYGEWPQKVKDEYAYNPEGARKLLSEAGYPKGFKTTVTTLRTYDVDLLAILKDYWAQIGVEVEIKLMETAAYNSLVFATGLTEGMSPARFGAGAGGGSLWLVQISGTRQDVFRQHLKSDPVFEAMVVAANNTPDQKEEMRITKEADLYTVSQHWQITTQETPNFTGVQPWVKRYQPVRSGGTGMQRHMASWIWIDPDIKKAVGR